jgi:hypothetical protein
LNFSEGSWQHHEIWCAAGVEVADYAGRLAADQDCDKVLTNAKSDNPDQGTAAASKQDVAQAQNLRKALNELATQLTTNDASRNRCGRKSDTGSAQVVVLTLPVIPADESGTKKAVDLGKQKSRKQWK